MIERLISKKVFQEELEAFQKLMENDSEFAAFVEENEKKILSSPKTTLEIHEGLLAGMLVLANALLRTGDLNRALDGAIGPQIHLLTRLGFVYKESEAPVLPPVKIPDASSKKQIEDLMNQILGDKNGNL